MDNKNLIKEMNVRRAHSEYIIAKVSVFCSLLVLAMALISEHSFWILIGVGVLSNIFTAYNLRKTEKLLDKAEAELAEAIRI